MAGVNFTREAAERIVAAVRKVERTPTNLVGERNPPAPADHSFWAWLSSAGGLNGLFWSWVRVQPVAELPTADDPWSMDDTPLFELATPRVAGYQTARESSNRRDVPQDTVVKLEFIGYASDGQPHYVFCYAGPREDHGGVPIHDHRDNVTGGGFSFATYHPGTALPQQPWHV